jgi:hypothetical protein
MEAIAIRKTKSHLGYIDSKNGWFSNNLSVYRTLVKKDLEKNELTFILDLSGNRRSSFVNTVDDYHDLIEYRGMLSTLTICDSYTLKHIKSFINSNPEFKCFVEIFISSRVDGIKIPLKRNCQRNKISGDLTINIA